MSQEMMWNIFFPCAIKMHAVEGYIISFFLFLCFCVFCFLVIYLLVTCNLKYESPDTAHSGRVDGGMKQFIYSRRWVWGKKRLWGSRAENRACLAESGLVTQG